MTKYWAFARGGAWRNPKPTGGPYVCEQCRLDACGGNDATLTITNNRSGPCGCVRRLRYAVVGETGGQRLSRSFAGSSGPFARSRSVRGSIWSGLKGSGQNAAMLQAKPGSEWRLTALLGGDPAVKC